MPANGKFYLILHRFVIANTIKKLIFVLIKAMPSDCLSPMLLYAEGQARDELCCDNKFMLAEFQEVRVGIAPPAL